MIEIDGGEGVFGGEHVADAVGVPGLRRSQGGGVVGPGVGSLVLACRSGWAAI